MPPRNSSIPLRSWHNNNDDDDDESNTQSDRVTQHRGAHVAVPVFFDGLLVSFTLQVEIRRIPVQNVDVGRHDVDVLEEVGPHKVVVALWVVFGDPDVLVHVERHHVLEGEFSGLVHFDERAVRWQRRAAGWKTEYKRALGGRGIVIDALFNVLGSPKANLVRVLLDDEAHVDVCCVAVWERRTTNDSTGPAGLRVWSVGNLLFAERTRTKCDRHRAMLSAHMSQCVLLRS